jgi:hypothetical protein
VRKTVFLGSRLTSLPSVGDDAIRVEDGWSDRLRHPRARIPAEDVAEDDGIAVDPHGDDLPPANAELPG